MNLLFIDIIAVSFLVVSVIISFFSKTGINKTQMTCLCLGEILAFTGIYLTFTTH